MLLTIAAVAVASAALTAPPDTTIAVRPGTSLAVNNFSGEINVRTWDKSSVRVATNRSRHDVVSIEQSGKILRIESRARKWVPGSVDYQLVVPVWMNLDLSGVNTDISIEGTKGEVKAETVQGEVTLRGATGVISLSSIQGAVLVERTRGRIDASSVNEGVHLEDVNGVVVAESVNGPLLLQRIEADSVEASTLNGCVTYEGTIRDRGAYHFETHNGAIDVAIPEHANVTLSVSTYSGGIDSSFPVTLKKARSKQYVITLGSGSAQLELESFQGTVYLRRPGEARAKDQGDSGNCGDSDKDDEDQDQNVDDDSGD